MRCITDSCDHTEVRLGTEDVDLGKFLAALREFHRDDAAARPTAHSSSVSSRDWQRVEEALSKREK